MMFHIDEQYLSPTTKEGTNMQRAIFLQMIKDERFAFKENLRRHPIALGACCSCI
jgi:hypothetical protein